MRKIVNVSLLLSLLLAAALCLQAQTRARRVGETSSPQPTAPQQPATQPASTPSAQKRPVLQGGTTISSSNRQPSPQSSPKASTPSSNEPEEVEDGDVVRVNTTLVSIPVTVMDRNGRFIPDLRQQEFRIYEDGVEQQVAYFASVEKPFTLALVLDTSASTRFRLDEIQDAAIAFVNQLRPADRVIIVSFDEEVRVLAEATSDRNVLRDAIRRTRTGGNTRLYDAVDLVINQRLNREQGRKAVILFTDGVDTASRHASYQSNVRDAEELDALIFPIQYDTYQDVNAGGGGGGGGTNWPSPRRRFPAPRQTCGLIYSAEFLEAEVGAVGAGAPSSSVAGAVAQPEEALRTTGARALTSTTSPTRPGRVSTAPTPRATSRNRSRTSPKNCAASTVWATTRRLWHRPERVARSRCASCGPTSWCAPATATSPARSRETQPRKATHGNRNPSCGNSRSPGHDKTLRENQAGRTIKRPRTALKG